MDEENQDEKSLTSITARYRSPCFSKEEVIALITLIDKYKQVILNKSITSPACHAKELGWSKITKIFNQKGFKHLRSADSLKNKWENLKKEVRRVSRNVIDLGHSEYKEVYDQVITLISEGENINNGTIEFSIHSDNDENEPEEQKESTRDSRYWEEFDRDSPNSTDAENGRRAHYSRSLNFSPQECGLLLKFVKQEKKVLFRKSTTTEAKKLKNIAWKRITDSYNKLSPERRTTKVLRTKFLNMKKLAKQVNTNDYKKLFSNKHEKLEYEPSEKIKSEPSYELAMEEDSTPNDDDDPGGVEESQRVTRNLFGHAADTEDPLNTVLNCDSGLGSFSGSSSCFDHKEIVKLKTEYIKYQMETAKLERKRLEASIAADAAERETRAIETAIRLRTARLDMVAAEMKLPTTHPALLYPEKEMKAQEYLLHHRHS